MDIKPATPSLDPLTKRHNWSWRCASKSLRSAWRCWEMQALDQKDLCQTPTEVQSSLSLDIFGYNWLYMFCQDSCKYQMHQNVRF